nr:hypothetical protein [Tanacetum cinerariifolium]
NEATISTPNGRQDVNVGQCSSTATLHEITRGTNRNVSPTHKKSVNFHTLITPSRKRDDVVVLLESIHAISEQYANTADGFFLRKWVAYPVIANYVRNTLGKYRVVKSMLNSSIGLFFFQFSFMDGLDSIPENGMLSYTRVMIEIRTDAELKDTIMVAMPKLVGEGFYTCTIHVEYERKPLRCAYCKVFDHVQNECPKNIGLDVSNNLKNPSQAPRERCRVYKRGYPNPFDVLNSVENDVDLSTNTRTSNLASKEANSSGSLFWNVGSSSTSTTPTVVEKNDNLEKPIIDEKIILVDDEGKPLKKVDYSGDHDSEDEVQPVDNEMVNFLASKRNGHGTDSLLEHWRETYRNADYYYDRYDDMYEGKEIPDNIQSICDKLDIKLTIVNGVGHKAGS